MLLKIVGNGTYAMSQDIYAAYFLKLFGNYKYPTGLEYKQYSIHFYEKIPRFTF